MSEDLFIRSLQGAGLEHDVELFLQRFHSGRGGFPLVIIADAPDAADSSEAMLPALRYLAREGIDTLILKGVLPESGDRAPSFAERLQGLGLVNSFQPLEGATGWPRGIAGGAQTVPTSATMLVRRLDGLGCRKIVVLDAQGVVRINERSESIVTVPEDGVAAAWLDSVDARQRKVVDFATQLAGPSETFDISVSLASPINLLAELFTVRGSGSFFRPPAKFVTFATPDTREGAMCDVVERAFGRTLGNRGFASAAGARVILETHRRAAAVLMPTPLGDYMSKFAVVREAQGTGIGAELWTEICAAAPALFWRSKNGNPINSWYARVADGMLRQPPWTYFWRGLDFAQAEAACRYAAGLPEDFLSFA